MCLAEDGEGVADREALAELVFAPQTKPIHLVEMAHGEQSLQEGRGQLVANQLVHFRLLRQLLDIIRYDLDIISIAI